MKKLAILTLTTLALALPATANAWTYSLSGSAVCNPQTGRYDISWTIDNAGEPETLSFSSRLGAGSADARGSTTQSETVSGSATSASLEVSGGWPSDAGPHSRSGSVSLAGNCHAPVTPPVAPPMGDDCPNLDGVQGSVPEGMVRDSEGNCVTRATTTEPQPTTSPPAALAATPVVAPAVAAPAVAAPVIITTQPSAGVASATKTKVVRKAAPKANKAKAKAKKKFSAGGIKGTKPSALPRTR